MGEVWKRGRLTEAEAEKGLGPLPPGALDLKHGDTFVRVDGDTVSLWHPGHYDDYRRSMAVVTDRATAEAVRAAKAAIDETANLPPRPVAFKAPPPPRTQAPQLSPKVRVSAETAQKLGLSATYTKLRSGEWGVRVVGSAKPGDIIAVTKRSGETRRETIRKVVWAGKDRDTGKTVTLASI